MGFPEELAQACQKHLSNSEPWHIRLRLFFTKAYTSMDMGDWILDYKALDNPYWYRKKGFKPKRVVYFCRREK